MINVSSSGIRTCTLQNNNNNETRCRKLALGEVKCSVDAAIFKDQRCYNIIMCMGDASGEYIAGKTTWF
jgi:hypothetical protein